MDVLPGTGVGGARRESGATWGGTRRRRGFGKNSGPAHPEGRPDLRTLSYLSSTEERSSSPTLVVFAPTSRSQTPDCWLTKNIGIAGTSWSMTLVASANLACAASMSAAWVASLYSLSTSALVN